MEKDKFRLLSPDGFPLEKDKNYNSDKEVQEALDKFVDKYREQGYYSYTVRIPIDAIKNKCVIIPL